MRDQPIRITIAAFALATLTASVLQAEEVVRFVEFRDGTRLQMTFADDSIPWRVTSADGESETMELSLGETSDLKLVYVSASRKLELVRQAIADLKSEDYIRREEAQQELLRLGGRYVPVLEKALEEGQEVDFLWRLSSVLDEVTSSQTENDPGDVYIDSEGNELEGDVANWAPKAKAYGTTLTLDRRQIARISEESQGTSLLDGPAVGLVRRIVESERESRFSGAMHINFEVGPEGRPLNGSEDIGEMFVPWGCVLETSYPDSPVVLESGFHVRGLSEGFCAANYSPRYRGVMTIRFCQPNQIESSAGVRLVGLWVAEVKPGGTTLEAYDAKGRLLSAITTTKWGSEFMALESAVPIAYLQIIPNEDRTNLATYDPNFAIDDLMFEPPLALSHEIEQFTLLLDDGQVLRGSQLEVAGQEVLLSDLSVGIEEIRVPISSVLGLLPIAYSAETATLGGHTYVMLTDGSVLRAGHSPEGWVLAERGEGLIVDSEQIVALWGESTPFTAAPSTWEALAPIVFIAGQVIELGEIEWGETWINSEAIAPPDEQAEETSQEDHTYATSPMLWLKAQPVVVSEQGRVRLNTGEEFVFSEDGFQLLEWNHERVRLSLGEATLEIPVSEIVLLVTDTPDS